MNNFDYDEFIHEANRAFMKHSENVRYGQFLMNYLFDNHPEIYSRIPQNIDPFYDNSKCGEFLKFIANLSESMQCATD